LDASALCRRSERLRGSRVAVDFFQAMGRAAIPGRTFTAQRVERCSGRVQFDV